MELAEFLMARKALQVGAVEQNSATPEQPSPSCLLGKRRQTGCKKSRKTFPEGTEGKSPPLRAQGAQTLQHEGFRRSCPAPAHGHFPSSAQASGAEGCQTQPELCSDPTWQPLGHFPLERRRFCRGCRVLVCWTAGRVALPCKHGQRGWGQCPRHSPGGTAQAQSSRELPRGAAKPG